MDATVIRRATVNGTYIELAKGILIPIIVDTRAGSITVPLEFVIFVEFDDVINNWGNAEYVPVDVSVVVADGEAVNVAKAEREAVLVFVLDTDGTPVRVAVGVLVP